jgi:benzaldehyde dehydrogenase (NAD)
VGDPASGQVALGPIIDVNQRDRIHHLVTSSVTAGARFAAGGTYQDLFYRPTVLADAGPSIPAYEQEVFGPVNDEAHAPFGGVLASGAGSRFGGATANIEAFTETRWITARGDIARYPF